MIANSARMGAKESTGARSNRNFVLSAGWKRSFVSILMASAMTKGMPPRAEPKTRIRFAPIRFWMSADHFRSATLRSVPEIITKTSISVRMFAIAAPHAGGAPSFVANTHASPPAAR